MPASFRPLRVQCAATRQRGAAIVTALLVIALAAVIVAGLFQRENLAIRSVENRASLAQTRWIERAVIDWAEVILRVDDSTWDHASDVWATPVMQTQLDETTTGGGSFGDSTHPAFLTGAMIDAQSRFNVNSLVTIAGLPSAPHLAALKKLYGLIGISPALADAAQARVLQAQTRAPDGRQIPAQAPPVLRLWDLRDVPGYEEGVLVALLPYVTVLPRPTRVNLNTAPAEVIASLAPSIDLAAAKTFVSTRDAVPFQSLATALQKLGLTQQVTTVQQPVSATSNTIDPNMASVGSNYFLVSGVIKYDRVESQTETLLRRDGNRPNALVQVVWQQRN